MAIFIHKQKFKITASAQSERISVRAGHFQHFLIFSIIKNYFLHFYQINLTGSGFF